MRWMMYRWWCEGGGDRAWWVIESVFLRSPDKGFWACLGDIPPDMPRRPETWVSLYNLMMKLCGISRSSAILGSDSPQSNNGKDHSLWVTPFIPRERPNVKHNGFNLYSTMPPFTWSPSHIEKGEIMQSLLNFCRVRTRGACMTSEAVRRSTKASRPLLK